MAKISFISAAALLLMPVLLTAAPASIYGKALQKARNVTSQAERSRTLPEEKPAAKPAAPAVDRVKLAKDFSAGVFKAKMKRYPVSGAAGINQMIQKKIIPANILGKELKLPVTEKNLPVAWFGTEANRARNKGVFPLFVTKPAYGKVIAGFTDGSVVVLKQQPKTVTGVIHILRSTAKNKKSSLWTNYQIAAGKIDKASK